MAKAQSKYDEVLMLVGEFGSYQRRIFLLLLVLIVANSWPSLYTIFTLSVPKHRCALPNYPGDTYLPQSPYHESLINASVPLESDGTYSSCLLKALPANVTFTYSYVIANHSHSDVTYDVSNASVKCSKWVYDVGDMEMTTAQELDIVCDRALVRSHSYLALFAGKMVGSFCHGFISDGMGRKMSLMLFLVAQVAMGFTSAFISNFLFLIVVRFIGAFTDFGVYSSTFVLALELVGPSHRAMTGSMIAVAWVIGAMLVAPVAYLSRHWSTMTLVLASPTAMCLLYWWLIPESPRWLIAKGRHKDAQKVVLKMAKVNGVTLDPEVLQNLKEEAEEGGPKANSIDLFKKTRTAVRYSILFFSWAVVSMVYYGITLNIGNLSGDIYVNYVLSMLVEMAGYSLSLLGIRRVGSKIVFTSCMFTSGVACLAVVIPFLFEGQDLKMVLVALSLTGKFAISAAFNTVFILTAELYPTVLRNVGLGTSSMFGRVGTFVSPYLADLGLMLGGRMGSALPLIVFGVCGVVAGLLSILLPSTFNVKLPETVEDAWDFGRQSKESSEIAEEKELSTF